MHRLVLFSLALAFTPAVAGCGGSGAAVTVPSAANPSPAGASPGNVAFEILIPNASAAHGIARRPAFVSPSADGALVTTYAHADVNHTAPLGSIASDISAASNACTAVSGGRTCTVTVSAPAGTDDFVFALYDAAPVNGTIPPTAHRLGVAGVTQTIASGSANVVSAPISAVIAGLGGAIQDVTEAADGHTHTIGLVIAPTDFGDNAITASASNAPYANPITAAVSESGGSGHTLLALNGGAPAAQVTLARATDTVAAVYDGGGSTGYSASVSLTANPVAGQGGATTESLVLTRSNLTVGNPTVFYTTSPAQLDTYPQGRHLLAISEPGAAPGTAYSASAVGCSNVLSVGTVVGHGTSAALLVVGGTQPASSGCSLMIGDGTATFLVTVTNRLRNLGAPSVTHQYATAAADPFAIALGADGNLWFTDFGNPAIYAVHADGSSVPNGVGAQGFGNLNGAGVGPDGNIWFGDQFTAFIGRITPSGTATAFTLSNDPAGVSSVAAGLDGKVWFSESFGVSQNLGSIDTANADARNEITLPNAGIPNAVALGPDGAIWFSDGANDQIGRVAGGVATEFPATTANQPYGLTAGSDGAIWFAEGTSIGRMTANGTLTNEYALPGASPLVKTIVPGPDGALWFADCGNDEIGRITTSGTITEYPFSPGASPGGVAVGPDGNLWFTQEANGKVGVLQL